MVRGAFGAIGYAAAKSGLDCIALDLKTGVIVPLNRKNLTKILNKDQALLEQMNASKDLDIKKQLELIKEFNLKHQD
ncbi:MAG: hypothetical protein QM734_00845 [Cyclobacteriaceae bacterium]